MRKTLESINSLNLKYKLGQICNIYIQIKNKIVSYNFKLNDNKLEKIFEYTFDDEILNFHINKENIIIIGKNNKSISQFNKEGIKVSEVFHYKKITNSIFIDEDDVNYLIISDKFGEIYIKDINKDDNGVILYGHSDPIHFMRLCEDIIISSDTFGKVKICDFPNVFNIRTVLLYDNEEIKYCDFLNKYELIIITKNELHLWSLEDFKIKIKLCLEFINVNSIISVIPFANHYILLETNDKNYFLKKCENKFQTNESLKKGKTYILSLEDKNYVFNLNDDEELMVENM